MIIPKKENIKLTIRPGKISFSKITDQLREKNSNLILVRVDIGNSIGHTNPDGTVISGNHIHIYQEGYEDKISQELPKDFVDPKDPYQTLKDFMKYCSITKTPTFDTGVNQYGN
ncbi:MAG TPA: hypothetical protein O0X32_02730 [Methanocorpusculum sp.]|nr:hypothetical protein [Methanocorpusculum sp.]